MVLIHGSPIRPQFLCGSGPKLRIQHIHIIRVHVTIPTSVDITFFDPPPPLLLFKTRKIQLELIL